MISRVQVVIATFLMTALQVAVGQEFRTAPPHHRADIERDEGPVRHDADMSGVLVKDLEGNTYRFESVEPQEEGETVPVPRTRITFTRVGDDREFVQEYEGIFQSPIAGRKGVYAIRSILPPPAQDEPPSPTMSVVAISSGQMGRLVEGMEISQSEMIDVLAGSPDMIFVVRDVSPLEAGLPDESPRMPNSPAAQAIRALAFDGIGLVEMSSAAR